MDICTITFTRLQQAMLRLLMIKQGESLTLRAIARRLHVSSTAVGKALPLLVKEGFVEAVKDDETKRYSIELKENREMSGLKRTENLKMLYESGLITQLEHQFAGGTIILFGSYANGEDTIHSDIDIAVIGRKAKAFRTDRYESMLERKISVQFYENMKTIHKHLRENILNGIVLSGGIRL